MKTIILYTITKTNNRRTMNQSDLYDDQSSESYDNIETDTNNNTTTSTSTITKIVTKISTIPPKVKCLLSVTFCAVVGYIGYTWIKNRRTTDEQSH